MNYVVFFSDLIRPDSRIHQPAPITVNADGFAWDTGRIIFHAKFDGDEKNTNVALFPDANVSHVLLDEDDDTGD